MAGLHGVTVSGIDLVGGNKGFLSLLPPSPLPFFSGVKPPTVLCSPADQICDSCQVMSTLFTTQRVTTAIFTCLSCLVKYQVSQDD